MRIAQLTYSTKPRGGVVHTLALAEALAARGHDVEVWTLGSTASPPTRGYARGIPVVRTIHHLDTFTTPQLVACHDRAVAEPIARLCVSHAVSREVEQAYGVRPEVIANGVDAERFAVASGPAGAAARAGWRGQLGDYVLALGGIEPRKGSIDLLEAFARVRDAHPARHRPTILGPVDDDALPALVAEARALAFVSTKEGFGLAAMEALAASTPVVARDLPVIREVFGDTVLYAATPAEIAARLDEVLRGDAPTDTAAGPRARPAPTRGSGPHGRTSGSMRACRRGACDDRALVLGDPRRSCTGPPPTSRSWSMPRAP
ncbi:hypothetical protein LUZ63_021717 [Rhynchospora breviuscula]|uniref:Glycosyltransferase n=1 Tax=Rhynchospora breviuscula TaxID=2022672 RepID=A0A9P9Z642_9POAL|nr:hypothetical protein LUZ63_021717 [Rhynchospora breviuscula]